MIAEAIAIGSGLACVAFFGAWRGARRRIVALETAARDVDDAALAKARSAGLKDAAEVFEEVLRSAIATMNERLVKTTLERIAESNRADAAEARLSEYVVTPPTGEKP